MSGLPSPLRAGLLATDAPPTSDPAALALGPVLQAAEGGSASRVLAVAWMRAAQGRWLQLRISTPRGTGSLRLCIEGTPGQWPDVTVALQQDHLHHGAWVFIASHTRGLSLHGPAAVLAAVHDASARLASAAPDDTELPVPVRTAALLQASGVRALHQVALDDDAQWPLRATGPDPQLRFQRLERPGRRHVHLALAVDDGLPHPPVLYWADGRQAYAADASLACLPEPAADRAPSAVRAYSAVLPALREGARWRLDPMERPGRFRLDAVQVRQLDHEAPSAWRWLGRVVERLQALGPIRRADDLLPVNELRPLDGSQHRFIAVGHDPQLRLKAPLAAGWYMLELALDLPAARARARIYLDSGSGDSEKQAWSLPLRSGRIGKRLLWVQAPSRLRLDPVAAPGEFGLGHFRLQRVSAGFACRRLRDKLARAGRQPASAGDVAALWAAYCGLFEPHHESALSYEEWIAEVEQLSLPSPAQQAAQVAGWAWKPLFSIITPTFDTPPALLRACLDSVLAQTYPHWELCIADDASTDPQVRRILLEYAACDNRVRVSLREDNGHIALASNTAIGLAKGDFLALLDHDDALAPHALFALAHGLHRRPSAQVVYSDEDKLDAEGRRCDPYFKPDYSPDLLRSQNYISHLTAYRRELVQAAGGFRPGYEGSQDYDLLLRCLARVADPADVLHVPQVLYHWRKTEGSTAASHDHKPYAIEAARRALQERADAQHLGAQVEVLAPGLYRHHWPIPQPAPRVSLIVPTRDGVDVLRACIDSIVQRTTYPNYEILVVDNQSTCCDTLAYLRTLAEGACPRPVQVLRYDRPFNYAAINNYAAAQARGCVLGLVNNDIEVISLDWLTEMVSHALRLEIGCVGAKLYYPDDTIQHAGVVLGIGGIAGHSHKYFPRGADGYFSRLRIVHNVSAVTGAALIVRKSVFEQVGGLDAEHLHVAFNDVDFCLKVREAGYLNVWTPFAELYHHESKTRGTDETGEKRARFERERDTMQRRWGGRLQTDPFYSPHLSLRHEDYSLRSDAVVAELVSPTPSC